MPLSGEAAAFGSVGPGAKAYFDYVNAHGGVYGRKIVYRYYDDGYDPSRTVQLTRQLVEQDKVFAIFNSVGTANNIAIRDYLNAMKVPQLFAGDGSDAIGGSPRKYPYTMGFLQSYRGEGAVYGRDLVKRSPKAKIAVLFENTDLGKDMTRGLSRAIAGKGPKIVASQSYEYTASGRLLADRAAEGVGRRHADALRDAEVHDPGGRRHPQARLEAAALHRVGLDRADDHGDRERERSRADEGRALDRLREEPERPDLGQGQGARALPAGDEDVRPVREAERRLQLVRHDRRLDDGRDARRRRARTRRAQACCARPRTSTYAGNPFLLPGIVIRTTPTQYFPLAQVYLYRWNNKQWVKSSGLLPAS